MRIALVVALFVALPLVVFRRGTLRRWIAFDVASWAFALALWELGPKVDAHVALIAFAVAKLAAFSIVLAVGRDVRWSPNRAAAIAALVYALVVPAQMQSPIDGDEPFYLLITESIVKDFDLDLANQYSNLGESKTGRLDLKAQEGDPTGPRGEQYSRHEPFLPILLIPGYLLAGLPGAVATIAIFGVLLVRSTMRLLEDEGISDATARAVFPLFALAPPVIFYAARIWPEVPGALCFVEALRGVRNRRMQRWLPAMLALVLLKVRFALIALVLLVAVWRRRLAGVLLLLAAIPVAMMWTTNVHSWRELLPSSPRAYAVGFFGLLTDGTAGFLFQAPIYLLGILAVTRWRSMPEGFRLGILASVLYVITLVPRTEWHGGWSPPLRYVVVFTPVLLLGVAAMWERGRGLLALAALWTIGLVAHGLAFPWRLFHIADGENAIGEWLSELYGADFSRMFPSFIRVNDAAWIAALAIAIFFGVRWRSHRFQSGGFAAALQALLLALWFLQAQKPAKLVHFEDAHVIHRGGELYPHEYAVARWYYRGGWIVAQGDQLSFLAKKGRHTLDYAAQPGTTLEIAGKRVDLPPTGLSYSTIAIDVPRDGRVMIRCLSGRANLDRMIHE